MGRAFEVRKKSMLKTGMAKTKIYTRYSKEIYLAAKDGEPNPDSNLRLKRIIDKAKNDQVPSDVIKRAIEKVTSGMGVDYKENRYEGFGPSGATIIIDCLTDNANRTISEVKNCFTKTENKIGVSGAVVHMFDNLGIISIKNSTEDEILELLLENDLDVEDIEVENDGTITLYTKITDFNNVRDLIGLSKEEDIIVDELSWLPQINVELNEEELQNFNKLIYMLNECEDVQNLYHNVENI